MSTFEMTVRDGTTIRFIRIGGTVWPEQMLAKIIPGGNLEKHLQDLKGLQMKDDDIVICTYPKSGTHWIWEIVSMLVKRKAEYEVKTKESAMMEFRSVDELAAIKSPRVLNTHLPCDMLPTELAEKKCKIILFLRNPKDVTVSFLNHIKGMFRGRPGFDTWEDIPPLMTGDHGFYFYYPWFQYVLEYEQLCKDNPETILSLYYEDTKKDPVASVRRLAKFLDIPCDDDLVEDIAKKCDFEAMKKADAEVKEALFFKDKAHSGQKPQFYRKGQVGDWKNWFTVAQNEKFDKWLAENFVNTDLKFQYTI